MTTASETAASGYRVSPQQEALWQQGTATCRMVARLALDGRLDRQRLLAAANRVIAMHEILRTTLVSLGEDGQAVQAVADPVPATALPEQAGEWPAPCSIGLRDTGHGCEISLSVERACADPWSLATILDELSNAYLDPSLLQAEDVVQYADLSEGYRDLLLDGQAAAFWRDRLEVAGDVHAMPRSQAGTAEAEPLVALMAYPDEWDAAELFARWVIFQSRWTRRGKLITDYVAPGTRVLDGNRLLGPIARSLRLPFVVDWSLSVDACAAAIVRTIQNDLAHADHFDSSRRDAHSAPEFLFEPFAALPKQFAGLRVGDVRTEGAAQPACMHLAMLGNGQLRLTARGLSENAFSAAQASLRELLSLQGEAAAQAVSELHWSHGADHTADALQRTADGIIDLGATLAWWAEHEPERCALRDNASDMSYAQLHAAVREAGNALAAAGVEPGAIVALQLPRSNDWTLWWLATWSVGGTVLPLSFAATPEQVAALCRRAGAGHIVSPVATLGNEHGLPHRISPAARLASGGVSAAPVATRTAYILFTSGSTGDPKATAISHGAHSTYLEWARVRYASEQRGGTLVLSEPTFDFTQTSLWLPLLAGEVTQFAPEGIGPDVFSQLLCATPGLAFLKLTPTHLQALAETESVSKRHVHWPAHVVVGGEALTGAMLPPSLRHARSVLHNEYGPTEATVGCCVHSAPTDNLATAAVPIGVAVEGTRLLVLDPQGNEVAVHGSGELYIAGRQLALGYPGDPRRTAAAFLPHPAPQEPGERCYRSGDMVSRLDAKRYQFLGRQDEVVKRNGVRIDLDDITAQMLCHPAVTGCHTFAHYVPNSSQPIVICAVTGYLLDTQVLRSWLARHLPALALPNRIALLAHLPYTPQGKIDRAALGSLLLDTRNELQPLAAGAESILGEIWRRVLGSQAIGPFSHFFVEGGDSIRAISVAVEARKHGLALAAEDIFRHPVLRELATIAPTLPPPSQEASPPAPGDAELPTGAIDRFPVSYLQMGMIFQNEAHAGDARYHDIFSYRLALAFDLACLREAARRLVGRHAALRTTYDLAASGDAVQYVWDKGAEVLDYADLSQLAPAQQEQAISDWIDAERKRGFDVKALPLLRFMVHRLGERMVQFTTSFHHVIMDGWSDQQLHTELFADYQALRNGSAVPVVPFDSRYRDFIEAERAALTSPDTRQFWGDYLADAKVLALATPPGSGGRAPAGLGHEHRAVVLAPSQYLGLQEASRQSGESLAVLLLAAHLVALHLLTGRQDVLSCHVVNCRLDGESMERSVGLFINSLPIRAQISQGDWRSLLERVGAMQRKTFAHRRLPFPEIQRLSGGGPVSDSLFYFTNFHNGIAATPELQELDKRAHEVTSFPLTASFNVNEANGRMAYDLAFARDQFSPARIEQIAACYAAALASLTHGVDLPLPTAARVPGLALSVLMNEPGTATPLPDTLPALFAETVERHGEATAVIAASGSMTRSQWDERSRAVAAGLALRGIGPGDTVALMLPRDLALPVALLGVSCAGAAFVMLAPDEPPARVAHILGRVSLAIIAGEDQSSLAGQTPYAVISDLQQAGNTRPSPLQPGISSVLPAYRMYTSGSTGAPKGVEVNHANFAATLRHFRAELGLDSGDRVMQCSAVSFDISLLELGLAIATGATLVMLEREQAITPEAYAPASDWSGQTLIQATPALWSVLRLRGFTAFAGLKILTGGEALPADMCAWLTGMAEQVWNVYGPTETTIWSTAARLRAGKVSIGRPIAGTCCYVLSDTLDPVAAGSEGELYIGGQGVSHGYPEAAVATAVAFVPDPFADAAGARMYRTGDRARMEEDGTLSFLGRADTQLKIAGHRLELEEVEARLRAHPAVADALVMPLDTNAGLAAHLVLRAGAAMPDITQLRTWLSSHLPPYAIPRQYGQLSELPRTPNGKLDRRAAPALSAAHGDTARYVPPEGALEQVVLQLWCKVLKLERISMADNFLLLGGYSLTAIQIAAQLRNLFGVTVSAVALFTAPTVREFTHQLVEAHPALDIERKAEILVSLLG